MVKIKNFNMFKTLSVFAVMMLSLAFNVNAAFAEARDDIEEPDYGSYIDFSIHMDVPDGFKERVEVYLDNTPFALYYSESKDNNGYDKETAVLPGTYKVTVLSSTDSLNLYVFDHPETFDPEKDKKLNITVKTDPQYQPAWDDVEYIPSDDDGKNAYFYDIDDSDDYYNPIYPSEYDYSEGEPYGTLHVKCKAYGTFSDVILRLLGTGHVYDIVLYNDNEFEANVKLPAGVYSESTTFKYTYTEPMEEYCGQYDLSYMWRHSSNTAVFGNTYTIEVGQTTELTDLIIYVGYDDGIGEVDMNTLVKPGVTAEQTEINNRIYEEKLNEAFPERVQETEPQETIASAPIPELINESAQTSFNMPLVIAAVAILIILIAIAVIIHSRRKRY